MAGATIFCQQHSYLQPGAVPEDEQARNRLLFYRRDTDIPKHRLNWNWIVDLPFGRGKAFGKNSRGFVNHLIGGWQIAGNGSLVSRYFQLPTGNWGPMSDVETYGKQYPIQDCRSGVCYDGYLYYNGYIPANRVNSVDASRSSERRDGRSRFLQAIPGTDKPDAEKWRQFQRSAVSVL